MSYWKIVLVAGALIYSGCIPVAVGGMFWSHNASKKRCAELMADPGFAEKIKTPEFQKFYQKVCKPK